jgi:hypothetical protein
MKKEKTQISKIRNAKEEIKTNTIEIQGIIRDYFENLYYSITLISKPDKNTSKKQNDKPISLINIDTKILNKIMTN